MYWTEIRGNFSPCKKTQKQGSCCICFHQREGWPVSSPLQVDTLRRAAEGVVVFLVKAWQDAMTQSWREKSVSYQQKSLKIRISTKEGNEPTAWRLSNGLVISEKERHTGISGQLYFMLLTWKDGSHISICSSWPLMALEQNEDYLRSLQEIVNTCVSLCCW